MTKNEIIEQIAKDKIVEEIVKNVTKRDDSVMKDLCQMIYLDLLEKEDDKIEEIYKNGQIRYFIAKMATNQYHSKNSPFHYTYRKIKYDELKEL